MGKEERILVPVGTMTKDVHGILFIAGPDRKVVRERAHAYLCKVYGEVNKPLETDPPRRFGSKNDVGEIHLPNDMSEPTWTVWYTDEKIKSPRPANDFFVPSRSNIVCLVAETATRRIVYEFFSLPRTWYATTHGSLNMTLNIPLPVLSDVPEVMVRAEFASGEQRTIHLPSTRSGQQLDARTPLRWSNRFSGRDHAVSVHVQQPVLMRFTVTGDAIERPFVRLGPVDVEMYVYNTDDLEFRARDSTSETDIIRWAVASEDLNIFQQLRAFRFVPETVNHDRNMRVIAKGTDSDSFPPTTRTHAIRDVTVGIVHELYNYLMVEFVPNDHFIGSAAHMRDIIKDVRLVSVPLTPTVHENSAKVVVNIPQTVSVRGSLIMQHEQIAPRDMCELFETETHGRWTSDMKPVQQQSVNVVPGLAVRRRVGVRLIEVTNGLPVIMHEDSLEVPESLQVTWQAPRSRENNYITEQLDLYHQRREWTLGDAFLFFSRAAKDVVDFKTIAPRRIINELEKQSSQVVANLLSDVYRRTKKGSVESRTSENLFTDITTLLQRMQRSLNALEAVARYDAVVTKQDLPPEIFKTVRQLVMFENSMDKVDLESRANDIMIDPGTIPQQLYMYTSRPLPTSTPPLFDFMNMRAGIVVPCLVSTDEQYNYALNIWNRLRTEVLNNPELLLTHFERLLDAEVTLNSPLNGELKLIEDSDQPRGRYEWAARPAECWIAPIRPLYRDLLDAPAGAPADQTREVLSRVVYLTPEEIQTRKKIAEIKRRVSHRLIGTSNKLQNIRGVRSFMSITSDRVDLSNRRYIFVNNKASELAIQMRYGRVHDKTARKYLRPVIPEEDDEGLDDYEMTEARRFRFFSCEKIPGTDYAQTYLVVPTYSLSEPLNVPFAAYSVAWTLAFVEESDPGMVGFSVVAPKETPHEGRQFYQMLFEDCKDEPNMKSYKYLRDFLQKHNIFVASRVDYRGGLSEYISELATAFWKRLLTDYIDQSSLSWYTGTGLYDREFLDGFFAENGDPLVCDPRTVALCLSFFAKKSGYNVWVYVDSNFGRGVVTDAEGHTDPLDMPGGRKGDGHWVLWNPVENPREPAVYFYHGQHDFLAPIIPIGAGNDTRVNEDYKVLRERYSTMSVGYMHENKLYRGIWNTMPYFDRLNLLPPFGTRSHGILFSNAVRLSSVQMEFQGFFGKCNETCSNEDALKHVVRTVYMSIKTGNYKGMYLDYKDDLEEAVVISSEENATVVASLVPLNESGNAVFPLGFIYQSDLYHTHPDRQVCFFEPLRFWYKVSVRDRSIVMDRRGPFLVEEIKNVIDTDKISVFYYLKKNQNAPITDALFAHEQSSEEPFYDASEPEDADGDTEQETESSEQSATSDSESESKSDPAVRAVASDDVELMQAQSWVERIRVIVDVSSFSEMRDQCTLVSTCEKTFVNSITDDDLRGRIVGSIKEVYAMWCDHWVRLEEEDPRMVHVLAYRTYRINMSDAPCFEDDYSVLSSLLTDFAEMYAMQSGHVAAFADHLLQALQTWVRYRDLLDLHRCPQFDQFWRDPCWETKEVKERVRKSTEMPETKYREVMQSDPTSPRAKKRLEACVSRYYDFVMLNPGISVGARNRAKLKAFSLCALLFSAQNTIFNPKPATPRFSIMPRLKTALGKPALRSLGEVAYRVEESFPDVVGSRRNDSPVYYAYDAPPTLALRSYALLLRAMEDTQAALHEAVDDELAKRIDTTFMRPDEAEALRRQMGIEKPTPDTRHFMALQLDTERVKDALRHVPRDLHRHWLQVVAYSVASDTDNVASLNYTSEHDDSMLRAAMDRTRKMHQTSQWCYGGRWSILRFHAAHTYQGMACSAAIIEYTKRTDSSAITGVVNPVFDPHNITVLLSAGTFLEDAAIIYIQTFLTKLNEGVPPTPFLCYLVAHQAYLYGAPAIAVELEVPPPEGIVLASASMYYHSETRGQVLVASNPSETLVDLAALLAQLRPIRGTTWLPVDLYGKDMFSVRGFKDIPVQLDIEGCRARLRRIVDADGNMWSVKGGSVELGFASPKGVAYDRLSFDEYHRLVIHQNLPVIQTLLYLCVWA